MTYDITIKKQGSTLRTIQGIEALTAYAAIAKVEKEFKQTLVQLLGRDAAFLEFEARRLDFSLS